MRGDSAFHAWISAISAFIGWMVNDVPLALLGVHFSVVVMAFSGVMLSYSVIGSEKRNWLTALLFTVGASALVNLVLHHEGLSTDYSIGMGFLLGFSLPYVLLDRGRSIAILLARVRGRHETRD